MNWQSFKYPQALKPSPLGQCMTGRFVCTLGKGRRSSNPNPRMIDAYKYSSLSPNEATTTVKIREILTLDLSSTACHRAVNTKRVFFLAAEPVLELWLPQVPSFIAKPFLSPSPQCPISLLVLEVREKLFPFPAKNESIFPIPYLLYTPFLLCSVFHSSGLIL